MPDQTVLIVDDEPNIRKVLGGVLEDEGYIPSLQDLRYQDSRTKTTHDWIYYPGLNEGDDPDCYQQT